MNDDKINLVEGETFTLKTKKEEEVISLSDQEINDKYRKGDIRIITEQGRTQLNTIVDISTLEYLFVNYERQIFYHISLKNSSVAVLCKDFLTKSDKKLAHSNYTLIVTTQVNFFNHRVQNGVSTEFHRVFLR